MTALEALFKAAGVDDLLIPRTDESRVDIPLTGAYGWGSIPLASDYMATYEEIVKRQLWARVAVNKLSYIMGRLPAKTYGADGIRLKTGSLVQLMRRPNDTVESGTMAGFFARISYDLFTYANAIVLKVQANEGAEPIALYPQSPRGWSRRPDGSYRYTSASGQTKDFPAWRVIHIMEPGPSHNGMGISRLEAARQTLAIEYAAQQLGVSTFQNGARPSGIITIKGRPKPEDLERFGAEIKRRFGGPTKSGLPAVLSGDIDWKQMAHNLDDSAVIGHRQITREEIAALYDIPQPAMGILDEANFASVDVLHTFLYQDTLGWPAELIEQALMAQLIDPVAAWRGQYIEFDFNHLLRGAYPQRMQGHAMAISAGVMTSDEVRAKENLPPMAGEQPEAGLLRFPMNMSTSIVIDTTGTGKNGGTNGA